MKKIFGTGLSGLIGTRVVELLSDKYEFEDLSLETGVDITDQDAVRQKISASTAKWIIHMAALTDVDKCEKDKAKGKKGLAWQVNVEGTRNIVASAKQTNKKVLYISTDFVFDGEKDYYTENDLPKPQNWYARTKYEGEKITLQDENNIVVRIAYPYRAHNTVKKDFVHLIINKLKRKESVLALTDHLITPTFIDDVALAIDLLIKSNATGVCHVTGSSYHTPFAAAQIIAKEFHYDVQLIKPITRRKYYTDRAKRPFQLRLRNDKIKALGLKPKTLTEGLKELKRQGVK